MRKRTRYMINLLVMDIRNQIYNKAIMIVIIIPFLFGGLMSYLYRGVAEADRIYGNFAFYSSCLMMVCVMGGISLPSMIADEKEHRTLRTLRQAGVSDGLFLLSKMSVCLLVTEVGCLLTALMTSMALRDMPLLAVLVGLTFLVFSFLGISISILSKTQAEVGVYSAPVMLILMVPALLGEMSQQLDLISRYTPLDAMMKAFWGITGTGLYNLHTDEVRVPDPRFHLIVLLTWMVVTGIVCRLLYKKKGL